MISAIFALAMSIVTVIIISTYTKVYIGSSYDVNISAGVISMTVFAIAAMFCSSSLIKKIKKPKTVKIRDYSEEVEVQF